MQNSFNLQVLNFQGHSVNVLIDSNKNPWFDAGQVCDVLGLSNTSKSLQRLDDDEKRLFSREEIFDYNSGLESKIHSNFDVTAGVTSKRGGAQSKWFVNEPGLYTLILGSEKPEAKNFKRWVTHEVLPSIRKAGKYEVPQVQKPGTDVIREFYNSHNGSMAIIEDNFRRVDNRLNELHDRLEALEKNNPIQATQASLSQIKADATEARELAKIMQLEDTQATLFAAKTIRQRHGIDFELALPSPKQERLLTPTEIGKILEISAREVNKRLEKAGLQIKVGDQWIMEDKGRGYGKYLDMNKKHSDGTPIQQLKWCESVVDVIRE